MSGFLNIPSFICARLGNTESRFGLTISSGLVGLLFVTIAGIYITPHFTAAFHGYNYSLLSNSPFDFSSNNPLRFRILLPLLGYLLFLRGPLFVIVPILFLWLLFSAIYHNYRRKNYPGADALLFSSLVAFSCAGLIPIVAAGYTDSGTYLFLFLAFTMIKRTGWSALNFALGLFNHECSLFLLGPLLLYHYYSHQKDVPKTARFTMYIIFAVVLYGAYRYIVAQLTSVEYDWDYYFANLGKVTNIHRVWRSTFVGAFFAFKLLWLLPMYALFLTFKAKEYLLALVITSIIFCTFLQLLIAYDITRIMCLAFPAILLSAERLKREFPSEQFTRILFVLILANLFVPQFLVADGEIIPMMPWPIWWALN